MASNMGTAIWLSARDWFHERAISICSILALASMLAPILVLLGVKNGVILNLRGRLLQNPSVLVITPKADDTRGYFNESFIWHLNALPGARFAIGRTREIATDMTLQKKSGMGDVTIYMEPCGPGEPVLEHNHLSAPNYAAEPDIVLAAPAAKALGVTKGDTVTARLGRRTPEGQFQSTAIVFHVTGILPPGISDSRMAFIPLRVLENVQDYRDYIAVPELGLEGRPREGERAYASFRLYARDLDSVETLAEALGREHIEVRTQAKEIAGIRILESSIQRIIFILSLAIGIGFMAFTMSSVQGAVNRKTRMLGMLRLLGFQRSALLVYPLMQTALTVLCGIGLAIGVYAAVSWGIDFTFQSQSQGFPICQLPLTDGLSCAGFVLGLSLLAALKAALAASSIEPSTVIREV